MKKKIGILFGGCSPEHPISIKSATCIYQNIDREKFIPILIGINQSGQWFIGDDAEMLLKGKEIPLSHFEHTNTTWINTHPSSKLELTNRISSIHCDIIFPILHGPMGEDGTVQGLLKLLKVPFVGSSVLGSVIGMDKVIMKRLLEQANLPILPYLVLHQKDTIPNYQSIAQTIGHTFFIKPANMGSSLGISKVDTDTLYEEAITKAFAYDQKIIIEQAMVGREIECAILGNSPPICSIPGEIFSQRDGFYSFSSKYGKSSSTHLEIPAQLPPNMVQKMQTMAIKAFHTLECKDFARVDFFLGEDLLVINEINTIPGFTENSMYPKLWEYTGTSCRALITKLISLAEAKQQEEFALYAK